MKTTLIAIENDADHSQVKAFTRSDLVPMLGTASRVSEGMSGKREWSMNMVRRLRERFNISADLLISRRSTVDSSAAA
jgi:antitoxin component HigA of HigAB toxin-antitoxin module